MSALSAFILGLLVGVIVWWIIDSAFWRPDEAELLAAEESQKRMQAAEQKAAQLQAALHKAEIERDSAAGRAAALASTLSITMSAQETAVSELSALHAQKSMSREGQKKLAGAKLQAELHREMIARENAEARIAALQATLAIATEAQETAVSELSTLYEETTGRRKPVTPPTAAAETAVAEAVETAAPPADPDDLTVVEGIGPKIDGVLKAAGVTTLAGVAETAVDRLKEILTAAGGRYRLANPESWPEQAGLAARGAWAELETLQDQLKGGRRAK
jgi:predicted flap endonuclease-1-like 5' DNA nuclease